MMPGGSIEIGDGEGDDASGATPTSVAMRSEPGMCLASSLTFLGEYKFF